MPRSRACDLNRVTESQNMQLYLYVYKCSCKLWYVTVVFMVQSLKRVLKIEHKLYVASVSVPRENENFWVCTWLRLYNAELQDDY